MELKKLSTIYEDLRNLASFFGVSKDCIFEQAVKIYNSEMINYQKKENIQIIGEQKRENIKEFKESQEKPKIPATESQKRYLEGHKIKFPKDITKQEAYILIKQDKEKVL